ncbi:MAG: 4Fe-4S binding protein [Anaerolineae bacterium]|nr:4Fe-4S binding protein [Anaerolineae bacterium]
MIFNFWKRQVHKPPAQKPPAQSSVTAHLEPQSPVAFIKVAVDEQLCHHCGGCVAVCPPDAIFLELSHLAINQETCTSCERCVKMCPVNALSMPNGRLDRQVQKRHA